MPVSTMQLTPIPPYDFARTIAAARTLYVAAHIQNETLRRVIRVGESLALIEVVSVGTVDQPRLHVEVLAADGSLDEAALIAKVRRVLNLDGDVRPFYDYARRDPVLWATVERVYGLHSLQADTLFEALALTMIEQQIALRQAQIGERWLLQWAGEALTYQGDTYYAFPSAARLAAATVDDLLPLKITFGRMQRLIDAARLAESLEALRDQPNAIAYDALLKLKGVGHWTAAWTLIRAQGHYRYVGSADVALRAAVNFYYHGLSGRADRALTDQTFEQYGEFAGLATYYTLMRWAFERYPELYL